MGDQQQRRGGGEHQYRLLPVVRNRRCLPIGRHTGEDGGALRTKAVSAASEVSQIGELQLHFHPPLERGSKDSSALRSSSGSTQTAREVFGEGRTTEQRLPPPRNLLTSVRKFRPSFKGRVGFLP